MKLNPSPVIIAACTFAALLWCGSLSAGEFKCTDARGKTTFSDQPCPETEQAEEIQLRGSGGDSLPQDVHPALREMHAAFDELETIYRRHRGNCVALESALRLRGDVVEQRMLRAQRDMQAFIAELEAQQDRAEQKAQAAEFLTDIGPLMEKIGRTVKAVPDQCLQRQDSYLAEFNRKMEQIGQLEGVR